MKYSIFSFLVLLLLFPSCSENVLEEDLEKRDKTICSQYANSSYPVERDLGILCDTDDCMKYLAIWKELIQEKNNFSTDFFKDHIDLFRSSMDTWNDGTSFRVCYEYSIDWATAYQCDKFIININNDNSHYPALDLSRGTDLTKEEVRIAVNGRAFSSSIAEISNINEIKFTTFENAMTESIDNSGVSTLCFTRLDLDRYSGNLILKTWAQYEGQENACISANLDLISGKIDVNDSPCYISGFPK